MLLEYIFNLVLPAYLQITAFVIMIYIYIYIYIYMTYTLPLCGHSLANPCSLWREFDRNPGGIMDGGCDRNPGGIRGSLTGTQGALWRGCDRNPGGVMEGV